jgi:hypothetical protein
MTAQCESFLDTSSWVALRWERRAGYYRAHLEQDLWGQWIVTRVAGRRGASRGRYITTWVASLEHGLITLGTIAKRRHERGYQLVP